MKIDRAGFPFIAAALVPAAVLGATRRYALAAPFAQGVRRVGPVPDQLATLTKAFAAHEDCDVIVTTGGASVGDHDLVRPAL